VPLHRLPQPWGSHHGCRRSGGHPAGLADQFQQGTKRLVGTRGFQRFLRIAKGAATVDQAKVAAEARYDGAFVLRTNTTLPAAEAAVQYKRLLRVEPCFRAPKDALETHLLLHQWDATIAGHIFCSFLALVLVDELQRCLAACGWRLEWADSRRDLAALAEVEVRDGAQWYLLRTTLHRVAGKVLQAVGVGIPPPVGPLRDVMPRPETISETYWNHRRL
jgi:hypothetical protein